MTKTQIEIEALGVMLNAVMSGMCKKMPDKLLEVVEEEMDVLFDEMIEFEKTEGKLETPLEPPEPPTIEERIAETTQSLEKFFGHQPAGIPVPIEMEGLGIVMAKGYGQRMPRRKKLPAWQKIDEINKKLGLTEKHIRSICRLMAKDTMFERFIERNSWWSESRQAFVTIVQSNLTKKVKLKITYPHVLKVDLKTTLYDNTYEAAKVWDIEHEIRALSKLKDHVTKEQYDRWFLTGMLWEKSKKSGVSYLFRRLRPTVAFRGDGSTVNFLAALCHHPVGYYHTSWAGALVPTDDLMSHLLMMRSDEHRLWKVSTQHTRKSAQADF